MLPSPLPAKRVAMDEAFKLGCVRRVGEVLHERGVFSLYKAQVRPIMDYAYLTWFSCRPSYFTGLKVIQTEAQKLVKGGK